MGKESSLEKLIFWFKNNKFFSVLIFIAVLVIAAANVFTSIDNIVERGKKIFRLDSDNSPTPSAKGRKPEFATVICKFGSKGIGPGMFNHYIWDIAVDGKGQVYVTENAEQSRIQVFDSRGTFITQWSVQDDTWDYNIAADRRGIVYAPTSNGIYRYEGDTGKLVGEIKYPGSWDQACKDLKIKFDGSIVTSNQVGGLILFDRNEKVIRTVNDAIKAHSVDDEGGIGESGCDHLAVDGLGNIYVIQHYGHAVYKFSSDGTFLNHFGSEGLEPGQFRMATAIAVDGRGRVYVSAQTGISVFDSEGRYITTFNVDNATWGPNTIVFNDENELFVGFNDRVVKVGIND